MPSPLAVATVPFKEGRSADSGKLSSCGDLADSKALAQGLFDIVVEGGGSLTSVLPMLLLLLRICPICADDRAAGPGPLTADRRASAEGPACELRFVSGSCVCTSGMTAGALPCPEAIPVSIRSGKGAGFVEVPEAMLLGVAGIGVRLLFLRVSRGGRRTEAP